MVESSGPSSESGSGEPLAYFREPSRVPVEELLSPEEKTNSRWGILLFLVYAAFYGGFVLLSAFNPDAMGGKVSAAGGLNVAITYGMALIIAALLLAMIYMFICKAPRKDGQPR